MIRRHAGTAPKARPRRGARDSQPPPDHLRPLLPPRRSSPHPAPASTPRAEMVLPNPAVGAASVTGLPEPVRGGDAKVAWRAAGTRRTRVPPGTENRTQMNNSETCDELPTAKPINGPISLQESEIHNSVHWIPTIASSYRAGNDKGSEDIGVSWTADSDHDRGRLGRDRRAGASLVCDGQRRSRRRDRSVPCRRLRRRTAVGGGRRERGFLGNRN